jgi:hypothetical protein
MKKILMTCLFMLATLAWAAAQQAGETTPGGSGQTTSPSAQTGATQAPPATAGSAGQDDGQAGMPGASPTVTEGCLGGSVPNYTVTAKNGTSYKLNIPPAADSSKLAEHVGESIEVAGNVNDGSSPSIDVRGIGKGTGTCPAGGAQSQPKR